MKIYLTTAILCLYASCSLAEVVIKNSTESNNEFVTRQIPAGGSIVHRVIETKEWDFAAESIITFYKLSDHVVGLYFLPISENKYEKLEIDTYEPEGNPAEVQSVFFANDQIGGNKKMFVIVAWHNHAGDLYKTYAYDKPVPGATLSKLVFLERLSEPFAMEGDHSSQSEHPNRPAKYKTAADVKAELKRRMK
jgi:hypothetical protein